MPDIFAAGDLANAYHPLLGRHLRVEHWDNAIGQGVVAAQNMLGKSVSYDRLPSSTPTNTTSAWNTSAT